MTSHSAANQLTTEIFMSGSRSNLTGPWSRNESGPSMLLGSHTQCFFLAHAVHARGSDGHQNVLSSIIFFELMPCTLEALTVIKTFCLWLAIPTYWRTGESKKPGVFQIQNKQTQPKTNPKQTKKTPRKQGETLRFQKRNPQAAQYCFTMSQQISQIDVPSDSKSRSYSRWWSCIIPVIEQRWGVGSPTST